MNDSTKELTSRWFRMLACIVAICALISYSANVICQWNFYNNYIDNGWPENLKGESLIKYMMAESVYGDYSISFSSPEEPHFKQTKVLFSPIQQKSQPAGFDCSGFYKLKPRPDEVIFYLQRRYPSDASSLAKTEDLSYYHSAIGRLDFNEHYYLIRNNLTRTNYFVLKSHYTGT